MMRISTNSIFDGSTARLTNLQSKMDRISAQVATGRRILNPSDDPIGSSQALRTQQSADINDQFAKNRISVRNTLSIAEGAMGSMVDTLQSIHEQLINAGNGALSNEDRSYIANTLQGQLDQLVSLANSTDGAGSYVFAGYKTGAQPYTTKSDGSIGYDGDTGKRMVEVDTARTMQMNFVGSELFPTDSNFFKALQDTIANLKDTTSAATTRQTQLTTVGTSFAKTMQSISDARSIAGVNLEQLDSLDSAGSDRSLQYAQTLSALQDLDYNQALSDLSRQQLALQAAQKTFVQTSNLSLFSYIS